jgi:hypothetical protein
MGGRSGEDVGWDLNGRFHQSGAGNARGSKGTEGAASCRGATRPKGGRANRHP